MTAQRKTVQSCTARCLCPCMHFIPPHFSHTFYNALALLKTQIMYLFYSVNELLSRKRKKRTSILLFQSILSVWKVLYVDMCVIFYFCCVFHNPSFRLLGNWKLLNALQSIYFLLLIVPKRNDSIDAKSTKMER